MKRKGWFIIPGVQDGDRTLEEQIEALRPALAICKGKSVLDLGCAEGLIGLEFARAGASEVHGMDTNPALLDTARRISLNVRGVSFAHNNLNVPPLPPVREYDFVLALGIIHKMNRPEPVLRWVAACTRELLLMRSGLGERGGIIFSKHNHDPKTGSVDRDAVLEELGFKYEKTRRGPPPHEEDVQYWRRWS